MQTFRFVIQQNIPNTLTYKVISPTRNNFEAVNIVSRDDIWGAVGADILQEKVEAQNREAEEKAKKKAKLAAEKAEEERLKKAKEEETQKAVEAARQEKEKQKEKQFEINEKSIAADNAVREELIAGYNKYREELATNVREGKITLEEANKELADTQKQLTAQYEQYIIEKGPIAPDDISVVVTETSYGHDSRQDGINRIPGKNDVVIKQRPVSDETPDVEMKEEYSNRIQRYVSPNNGVVTSVSEGQVTIKVTNPPEGFDGTYQVIDYHVVALPGIKEGSEVQAGQLLGYYALPWQEGNTPNPHTDRAVLVQTENGYTPINNVFQWNVESCKQIGVPVELKEIGEVEVPKLDPFYDSNGYYIDENGDIAIVK